MKRLFYLLAITGVLLASCGKENPKKFTIALQTIKVPFDFQTEILVNGNRVSYDSAFHVDANSTGGINVDIESPASVVVLIRLLNWRESERDIFSDNPRYNKEDCLPNVHFIYDGIVLQCKKDPHYGSTQEFFLWDGSKNEEFHFEL